MQTPKQSNLDLIKNLGLSFCDKCSQKLKNIEASTTKIQVSPKPRKSMTGLGIEQMEVDVNSGQKRNSVYIPNDAIKYSESKRFDFVGKLDQ